jgi:hypothetical protein
VVEETKKDGFKPVKEFSASILASSEDVFVLFDKSNTL